jgi:hypothetical protein
MEPQKKSGPPRMGAHHRNVSSSCSITPIIVFLVLGAAWVLIFDTQRALAPAVLHLVPAAPTSTAYAAGAGTQMWQRWEAIPGSHPLCDADYLRAQFAAAPRPEQHPGAFAFSGSRPTAAGIGMIGIYPKEALQVADPAAPIPKGDYGPVLAPRPRLLKRFREHFLAQDKHFFSPYGIDYVLLLQEGSGIDCALLDIFIGFGWSLAGGGAVTPCSAPTLPGTAFGERNASGVYRTARGTRAVVLARNFALPRYVQRNPALLDDPTWRTCGFRMSISYNLFTAAYVHHAFVEPALDAYDATFKVDVDVVFSGPLPKNPLERLRGCSVAHVGVLDHESCNVGAREAVVRFGELTGRPPASLTHGWFQKGDFFRGEFNAGLSHIIRSPGNTILHTWLYECNEGFFRTRWGDQAVYALFFGYWRDIPDVRNNSEVCDFSGWPLKQSR